MDIPTLLQLVRLVQALEDGGKLTDFITGNDYIIIDIDNVSFRFDMMKGE